MFVDEHWANVGGGYATAEDVDGVIYLGDEPAQCRRGDRVCQGWGVRVGLMARADDHLPEDELRPQTRDLYIPAGDVGLWQGAIRERSDPITTRSRTRSPNTSRSPSSCIYSDQVGAQRTMTRFTLVPIAATTRTRHELG